MRRSAILMTMLLAACASRHGDYPSLAHRPVENGNFDEPARPVPVQAPDQALDRLIATSAASLDGAIAAFDKALSAAEQRTGAAHGKPAGSDAWIDAQQALAKLEDGRADVAALATDIDTAASDRAAKLQPAHPTLDALATRIDAELARERAAVDRLQAMLAPG